MAAKLYSERRKTKGGTRGVSPGDSRQAGKLPGGHMVPEKGLADRGDLRAMLATARGGDAYRRSAKQQLRRRRDFGEQQNGLPTAWRNRRRVRSRRRRLGAADGSAAAAAMALGELGFLRVCRGEKVALLGIYSEGGAGCCGAQRVGRTARRNRTRRAAVRDRFGYGRGLLRGAAENRGRWS